MLAWALCAMRPNHLFRFGHAFFTQVHNIRQYTCIAMCCSQPMSPAWQVWSHVMFYLELSTSSLLISLKK